MRFQGLRLLGVLGFGAALFAFSDLPTLANTRQDFSQNNLVQSRQKQRRVVDNLLKSSRLAYERGDAHIAFKNAHMAYQYSIEGNWTEKILYSIEVMTIINVSSIIFIIIFK